VIPHTPHPKSLFDLPTSTASQLIIVKTDASIESDPFDGGKELATQGIGHLNLVIANMGVPYVWPKVSGLKIADLQTHLMPNVFGVFSLYQATLPLLLRSENPKWVTMALWAPRRGGLRYASFLFLTLDNRIHENRLT
jgi:hypothetical protein